MWNTAWLVGPFQTRSVWATPLTIFKGALIHRPPPSLAFGPASLSRQQGKVRTQDHHLWSTHLFRSSSSKDQKILMSPPHPRFFDLSRSLEVVWTSSESYSSSFVLLSSCLSVFCLSVSISKLFLIKVPIDGAHVTDICCIS